MASGDLVLLGIVWTVLGVLVAVFAAARGRPFLPWLLYGVAFWPLALVHLAFWKPRNRETGPLDEDEG